MPLALSDSATVGTTLMLRLRNASTTVASPAPVCRPMAVAPVTWYHNGEPSAHRSAFCVTEVSALAIDQYGSQPLTIRRGRLSALAAGPPASSPRARSDAASAQQTRAALRRRACMDLSRVRGRRKATGPARGKRGAGAVLGGERPDGRSRYGKAVTIRIEPPL